MNTDTVKVWDPFVRIFHWSLVGLFTLGYVTGETEGPLHVWSGYAVLLLIALRIIWGFIGSEHARFSDFVRSPFAVLRYLKGIVTGQAPRTLGHNPAGGWMVVLLLVSILATGGSGVVVLGLEGEGPLAGRIAPDGWLVAAAGVTGIAESDDDEHDDEYGERRSENAEHAGAVAMPATPSLAAAEDAWEEIHEFFANLTVVLVFLHIAGVIISSIAHRENLVRAMFSGTKRAP